MCGVDGSVSRRRARAGVGAQCDASSHNFSTRACTTTLSSAAPRAVAVVAAASERRVFARVSVDSLSIDGGARNLARGTASLPTFPHTHSLTVNVGRGAALCVEDSLAPPH